MLFLTQGNITGNTMENKVKTILTLDDHDHCLTQKTEAVENTFSGFLEAKEIIKDLKNTLSPYMPAAGLAAPQIGILKTIFIFSWNRLPEHLEGVINPIFYPLGTEKNSGWEGCFSVPLALAYVPRYQNILATYTNIDDERVTYKLQGFAARVFQHECDHLQGIENIHRSDAEVKEFTTLEEMMAFIQDVKKDDAVNYIKPEFHSKKAIRKGQEK